MSEFSERIVKQTEALLHFQHDETLQETTPERLHEALGQVIMMEISDKWTKTKRRQAPGRRAFYFSAEYLVGRLVYSNLFNLGILRGMKAAFAEKGVDLACLEHIEDAALGNGGLGRLAACFLDSAATLDLPLTGYGLFKQSFVNGCQRENADDWTKYGDPWSHRRDKLAVKVKFADQTVNCVPYDMPVIGYETTTVGTLRLWQCEAEEELNFDAFNAQDYVKALERRTRPRISPAFCIRTTPHGRASACASSSSTSFQARLCRISCATTASSTARTITACRSLLLSS